MADSKIKDLTLKATAASTDEFVINDVAGGNVDKKLTLAEIEAYVEANVGDTFLPLAGGIMTGNIDTNGNSIILDADGDTSLFSDNDDDVILSNSANNAVQFYLEKQGVNADLGHVAEILWRGGNDLGTNRTWARISGIVQDNTDATEDGRIEIDVMSAGTLTTVGHFHGGNGTPRFDLDNGTNIWLDPLAKIYLDGGGDTYITETSANLIQFFAGGNDTLSVNATDTILEFSSKIYFDGVSGVGGDTYISSAIGDELKVFVGGVNVCTFAESTGDGVVILGTTEIADGFHNKGMWSQWIDETNNVARFKTKYQDTVLHEGITCFIDGEIGVDATEKIYLDGIARTGDTYITESSANQLDFVVGGDTILRLTADYVAVESSEPFYLDGGSDTYLDSNSADQIRVVAGGVRGFMVQEVGGADANCVVGAASAEPTTATNGFLYIPTCPGVPTGTPTSHTGKVPLIYDTTNNDFYIYNGSWKSVNLT